MRLMTIGEVARCIGVPQHKLTYAFSSGRLPEPQRVLGRRAFSQKDIARAAKHFGVILPDSETGKGAE